MRTRSKPFVSLGVLAVFGLAFTCDASAAPLHDDHRTSEQIQTCIDEIGARADFSDATRVVHVVSRLRQRNYEELEIRVDTSIFGADDAVEEYATSCLTGTTARLVRFRINPVED